MRQFDVFANSSPRSNERAPYLIVLPFRFFLDRRTTIIAPLVRNGLLIPVPRLNPIFDIEERQVMLSPLELVSIPTVELQKFVTSLDAKGAAVIGALDLLFTGV